MNPTPAFVLGSLLASTLGDPALGVVSDPTYTDNGTVSVKVTTTASWERVEAALSDPAARLRMVPNVVRVDPLGSTGGCTDLRVTTESMGGTYIYDTRSCRTADGWHETMIRSEDLEDVQTTWILHRVAAGVEVNYISRVVTRFPAPQSLVARAHASAMVKTMERLVLRVGR